MIPERHPPRNARLSALVFEFMVIWLLNAHLPTLCSICYNVRMINVRYQTIMRYLCIIPLVWTIFGVSSCRNEHKLPEGSAILDTAPPADLQASRLLFQRPDGIYLLIPFANKQPKRVTDGGTYPRWFPDGVRFSYIRDGHVYIHNLRDATDIKIATDPNTRAVAINPVSEDVFFSSNSGVYRVKRGHSDAERLLSGDHVYGLSVHANTLMTTEKATLRGFGIVRRHLTFPERAKRIGDGCSASISPDGKRTTLNLHGHRKLAILNIASGHQTRTLTAPPGEQFDNHAWSNHTNWIASVSHEGNVLIQRVSDSACWQVTHTGDANRPDLFIP
jgi:hypothetical protein